MELQILLRKENFLLGRSEIRFKILHENEAGMNREKIREKLSASLSVSKECVIINDLHSEFGKPEITGYAKIYKDKESAMKIERKHILIRNKLMEPEKKEIKKKAAPPPKKEEAPVKTAEKKEDDKKEKAEVKKPPIEDKKVSKDDSKGKTSEKPKTPAK